MTRKEYAGIDLFKLIFSFFVIFIHCHPEGTVPFLIANGVGRLAVPFFFVAAGYFLGKKVFFADKEGRKRASASFLRRILKMYLIWTVIYLPLTMITFIVGQGMSLTQSVLEYIRSFFFLGSASQLWYLPALLVGAALCCLLTKKLRSGWVFAIGLMLFLVGIFNEAYAGLCPPVLSDFYELIYNPLFVRTRNGLFFATVFVAMGFLFAENPALSEKKRPLLNGALTLLFTGAMCAEAYLLNAYGISGDRYGMYLFALPAAFFCFRFAYGLEMRALGEKRAYLLRKLSTVIYLLHQLVNGVVVVTVFDTFIGVTLTDTLVGFLLITLITLPLSLLMARAGMKKSKVGSFFAALA